MNKKAFALIEIMLVIGAVIIASGVWYYVAVKKSQPPQPTQNNTEPPPPKGITIPPAANEVPPANPPPASFTTATWKTYKDYENNYEFKYPPSYSLEDGGGGYVSLKTASIKKHNNFYNTDFYYEYNIRVFVSAKEDTSSLEEWLLKNLKGSYEDSYSNLQPLDTASDTDRKNSDKIFYAFTPFQTTRFTGLKEKLIDGTWVDSITIYLWDREQSKVYGISLSPSSRSISLEESNNDQEFILRTQELIDVAKSLKVNVEFAEKNLNTKLSNAEYRTAQENCSSTAKVFLEKIKKEHQRMNIDRTHYNTAMNACMAELRYSDGFNGPQGGNYGSLIYNVTTEAMLISNEGSDTGGPIYIERQNNEVINYELYKQKRDSYFQYFVK